MSKKTKRVSSSNQSWQKKHKILIICITVAVLITSSLFIAKSAIDGDFRYWQAAMKCGTRPVVGNLDYKTNKKFYILPSEIGYSGFTLNDSIYFCAEQEAIDAGYKRFFSKY